MTHTHMHMDRTIFLIKAGTLATSLYILICSQLDENQPTTMARIRGLWNGTEQELIEAAEELTWRGILAPMNFSQDDKWFRVVPSTRWFPQTRTNGFGLWPKGTAITIN
jgi:hypothetical protein